MTDRAAGTINQQRVACPSCQYPLRGLQGDVVACPECGMQCNIESILTGSWTKPWRRAPGYEFLMAPLMHLYMIPLMLWVFLGDQGFLGDWSQSPLMRLVLLYVPNWLWNWLDGLRACRRILPGDEGLWLSLRLHVVAIGYFGSIPALIFIFWLAIDYGERWALLALPAVPVWLVASYRLERGVARACIRHAINGTLNEDAADVGEFDSRTRDRDLN